MCSFDFCPSSIEHVQAFGIVIEQHEGADDLMARQEITAFVFLEYARPTADERVRLLLGEVKLGAAPPDLPHGP